MEDLNNQQMILLTLLVSFVSSIATSIVIVSMLTDSTPTVTQTINRIVEKTIERVVPGATSTPIFKPVQVPVSVPPPTESDMVVTATQKISSSIGVLSKDAGEGGGQIGFAFAVGTEYVATDRNILDDGKGISILMRDGKEYACTVVYSEEKSRVAILQLRGETATSTVTMRSVTFSGETPKLGQTVLFLGGKRGATLSRGFITDISSEEGTFGASVTAGRAERGGPLFDLSGNVIGMNVLFAGGEQVFLPASSVTAALTELKKTSSSEKKPEISSDVPAQTAAAGQAI